MIPSLRPMVGFAPLTRTQSPKFGEIETRVNELRVIITRPQRTVLPDVRAKTPYYLNRFSVHNRGPEGFYVTTRDQFDNLSFPPLASNGFAPHKTFYDCWRKPEFHRPELGFEIYQRGLDAIDIAKLGKLYYPNSRNEIKSPSKEVVDNLFAMVEASKPKTIPPHVREGKFHFTAAEVRAATQALTKAFVDTFRSPVLIEQFKHPYYGNWRDKVSRHLLDLIEKY
jgi:hypothetical protein